jgi:hypothetical protein
MFFFTKKKPVRSSQFALGVEKHPYEDEFELEVKSWCYGLSKVEGQIIPAVIYKIVKELAVPFERAIREGYAFDIIEIAEAFYKASRRAVTLKELVFNILVNLPFPLTLDDHAKFVFTAVVTNVEKGYGGAVERLKRKWQIDQKRDQAELPDVNHVAIVQKQQARLPHKTSFTER